MKVFKLTSRLFKLHCSMPLRSTNKWKYRGCVLYAIVFIVEIFISGVSSLCYFAKSVSYDKSNAFCAIYQLVVVTGPLYSFSIAQILKMEIQRNFNDFQTFYDQNKVMDPLGFMQTAEKRGRQSVKAFLSFVVTASTINLVTSFGSLAYHKNKNSNLSNYEVVHRPYRYVLPWDQNTLNGWMWEMAFSFLVPVHYFMMSSALPTLLFTICEYHRSFCKIIDFRLTSIDKALRSETYNVTDLMKMFRKTVFFHSEAKQLFVKSVELFTFFIAGELIHFILLMTFVLFHLDYAIRNLSLQSLLMVMGIVYTTLALYLYCYCGQVSTDSYTSIADRLYNSEWINAPIKLRRMYVLMIAHAQKKLYYRGYGVVDLNMETYLRIIKSVVGYVLMFKSFAEA